MLLGYSEEAFWEESPRRFFAVLDRYAEQEKRANNRAAMIVWSVFKSQHGKRFKVKPEDMLRDEKPKARGWQRQLKVVELLNAAYRGKDKRVNHGG